MSRNVDVLYIHSTEELRSKKYSIMPLGIVAILNLLIKEGYGVYGINIGIENSLDETYHLKDDLMEINYKVLLIDLHWYVTAYGTMQAAQLSKQLYPDVPVVVGGITATIFSKEIIRDFLCIDYIVKGDSELPNKKLMDYLIKKTGSLKEIPNICFKESNSIVDKEITCICKNIDKLDFISRDFLKNNQVFFMNTIYGVKRGFKFYWINNGRGCIHNCSYCGGAAINSKILFGRNEMIMRSVDSIINDIKRLYEEKVKIIGFTHDFEMYDDSYYQSIFKKIKEKGLIIGLQTHCNQLPTKKFIAHINETFFMGGSILDILPLSGDEKVRIANGKKFSNSDFMSTLEFMAKHMMRVRIIYSVNIPGESLFSFQKTVEQIEEIYRMYPHHLLKISCDWFIPDPLSLYNRTNKEYNFRDYYNYCIGNATKSSFIDDKDYDNKLKILNSTKNKIEKTSKETILTIGSSVV